MQPSAAAPFIIQAPPGCLSHFHSGWTCSSPSAKDTHPHGDTYWHGLSEQWFLLRDNQWLQLWITWLHTAFEISFVQTFSNQLCTLFFSFVAIKQRQVAAEPNPCSLSPRSHRILCLEPFFVSHLTWMLNLVEYVNLFSNGPILGCAGWTAHCSNAHLFVCLPTFLTCPHCSNTSKLTVDWC